MRFANDTHSRMLNRREMIGAGLVLGLTGRAFAGRPGKRIDASGNAGASGGSAGQASVQGPPALLDRRLEETCISGPTGACGVAYGRLFGDLMNGYMARETKPSHTRLAFAKACLPFIEKHTPFSFEFLRGTAEGSGFSLEEVTLLSLYEEIWKGSGLAAQRRCLHLPAGRCQGKDGGCRGPPRGQAGRG